MKKQQRKIILGFAMVLSLLSSAATLKDGDSFTGKTTEGIEMNFRVISAADKTCAVYQMWSNRWYPAIDDLTTGKITIPETVQGFTVIEIGNSAFQECKSIESVSIPKTVKTIGESAFGQCQSLKTVTGYSNVEYLGNYAFDETPWKESLPDGLLYIGKVLYLYKGTMPENTSIQVKDGTTCICGYAFYGCDGLVSITIPKSVTEISCDWHPANSIMYCKNLSSIVVSSANPVYDSRGNCNAIIRKSDNMLVIGCAGTYIPDNVKSIGDNAFCGNGTNEFFSITIPNSVESIGSNAFNRQDNLMCVTIGKGIQKISGYAFANCSKLSTIRMLKDSPCELGRTAFSSNVYESATLFIPTGSKLNYWGANEWNQFKTMEELGNSGRFVGEVWTLTYDGIRQAYRLTNLDNPTSELVGVSKTAAGEISLFTGVNNGYATSYEVVSVGKEAFKDCKQITGINIHSHIQTIGESAFNGCQGLSSITIPSNVKEIGSNAFWGCDNLKYVNTLANEPASINQNTFSNKLYESATLFVPVGTKSKYKAAIGWNNFKSIIEGDPSGIETLSVEEKKDIPIYNLLGHRLESLHKGLIIVGGKKVFVK